MQFLRASDVIKKIAVSKSMFWEYVKKGNLPPPIKTSPKISLWRNCDIEFAMEFAYKNGRCPEAEDWEKRKEEEGIDPQI
jgi:predicted DNA-binding transcriptional regulator AlpA